MTRSVIGAFAVMVAAGFAGCAATSHAHAQAMNAPQAFAAYSEATPAYKFFPGDQIEVIVNSAPELTRTVTVAPDGRISLPLIEPVQAADRTAEELRDALVAAYARQLRAPEIDVVAKAYASRQVFVGGEVARPGVYEMPAYVDALQAVAMAGGFLSSAKRDDVLILSRASGANEVRTVNLTTRAIRAGVPAAAPLSRYDVVFVPRSHIGQVGLFMQQYVRDALPISFNVYYDLNGNRNN
ncbi:MAG: polysaccharide biosynthesis/export family protein [Hyphomonadaceae bacterium]